MERIVFVCAVVALLVPLAHAQFLAGEWSNEFFIEGPETPPEHVINHQGRLIIAGDFTTAGDAVASYTAWYDGDTWRAFGAEVEGPVCGLVERDGVLLALVKRMEGFTTVALRFWALEGLDWVHDGDEFSPSLPSGPLVSFQGQIYKGGHIWNGTEFEDFLLADGSVQALIEYDGLLAIGGYFQTCDGDSLGRLVAWDGESIVMPWPERDDTVEHLEVHQGDLIATTNGYHDDCVVHRWTGTAWEDLPFGSDRFGLFTFSHGGDLYVSSGWSWGFPPDVFYSYGFHRYEDGSWESLIPGDFRVHAATSWGSGFVVSCQDVELDGRRYGDTVLIPDQPAAAPILSLGPTGSGLRYGSVSDLWASGALWIAGSFRHAGTVASPSCIGYSGSEWYPKPFGFGHPWSHVNVILRTSLDFVVGGCEDQYNCGAWRSYGESWIEVPGVDEVRESSRAGVYSYGSTWNSVYRVSGSSFYLRGTVGGGSIRALCEWNDALVVGGTFTEMDGQAVSRICRYENNVWTPFPSDIGSSVDAMTEWNGQLVIGGRRIDPEGPNDEHVAIWADPDWSILGGRFHGDVFCLAEYQGYLFAGGRFDSVGTVAADNLACWDGDSWRSVGTGCNDSVHALEVWNDRLWIGGKFTVAGGVPASLITSFTVESPLDAPVVHAGALALAPARPNPFNPRTTLRFTMPSAGTVSLAVFDLHGRRVRDLVAGRVAAGEHSVVWDGRDASRREVPSGVYFSRLEANGEVAYGRMTLVR